MNRQLYTSTDHMSGEFHYSGRLSKPQKFVRCDIGITVHEDNDIQFYITNAHLPCQFGRFMIYESTNLQEENRRGLYCDQKLDLRRNISIQFHQAVVTFIMKKFSPNIILLVHFSAVSRTVELSSDNRHTSNNVKGQRIHKEGPTQAVSFGDRVSL